MLKKIKHIEDVAAWQLCCGCGACASVCPEAIEMFDALDYGRRPRFREGVDAAAAQDAMAVCPGIELTRLPKPASQLGDQSFFDAWGPVLGVWEGHAADPQIRFEGSSGGAATALGLFAMECLSLEGVLHTHARKDVPYLNKTVLSRTKQDLLAGAGSRYAPASPCDELDLIKKDRRPCVFIGKPCDVAAVHKAMASQPQLAEKIGLTIAFFCAGTPSTAGTLEMLRRMGVDDPNSVTSVRYRGCGWPGNAVVEFLDKDGSKKQQQLTYDQSWGEILQKYRQWRCYICPDHIGEYADITVADAWHRDVNNHQPGRSMLIARTVRGKTMLEQAIRGGYLEAEMVSSTILPRCRLGQAAYQGSLWARISMLKVMRIPVPEYQGFNLFLLWRSELSSRRKIKSFLSTLKRIFVKKLYYQQSINQVFQTREDEGNL
jgi:coenzyme F420 hydrogenase subunit beta